MLEDRLGRDDDARAAYRAALELDPAHPAALMALLTAALRAGDRDRRRPRPGRPVGLRRRAADAGAVRGRDGRRRARSASPPRPPPRRAPSGSATPSTTLLRLSLPPAAEEPIAAELHRLSQLVDDPDVRTRVLDFLDSRINRSESPLRARGRRSWWRCTGRRPACCCGGGPTRRRWRCSIAGLRVAPDHPLLIADVLRRRREGRAGPTRSRRSRRAADAAAAGPAGRGPAAARGGGGARGSAGRGDGQPGPAWPAAAAMSPLVTLARIRVVARSGDAEGLARLFIAEAERLVAPREGFRVNGVAADSESAREAAHLLVRAAIIHHQVLKNARAAPRAGAAGAEPGARLSPAARCPARGLRRAAGVGRPGPGAGGRRLRHHQRRPPAGAAPGAAGAPPRRAARAGRGGALRGAGPRRPRRDSWPPLARPTRPAIATSRPATLPRRPSASCGR